MFQQTFGPYRGVDELNASISSEELRLAKQKINIEPMNTYIRQELHTRNEALANKKQNPTRVNKVMSCLREHSSY